jgi:hypothetical protein
MTTSRGHPGCQTESPGNRTESHHNMKNFKAKTFALAALIIALFGATAACGVGEEYATSTSDTHVCVFDGSERGGQRLKFQIAPGA